MNLVKINSINIWDEEWENGTFSTQNGAKITDNTRIRSKNLIPVNPSTTYYFNLPSVCYVFEYDANNNLVDYWQRNNTMTLTVTASTHYISISPLSDYGTSYKNDIQICLNSESQKTTYHPHWVLGLDGQGRLIGVE